MDDRLSGCLQMDTCGEICLSWCHEKIQVLDKILFKYGLRACGRSGCGVVFS